MLVSNDSALRRLSSSENLINKMKSGFKKNSHSMQLFGMNRNSNQNNNNQNSSSAENKPVSTFAFSFNKPRQEPEETQKESHQTDSNMADSASTAIATLEKTSEISETNKILSDKPPLLDDILQNADSQIKLGSVHNQALEVLESAIREIKIRIPEMKADKLPSIITATSKVITDIRRERNESNKNGRQAVNIILYAPEQKSLSDYEVIEV